MKQIAILGAHGQLGRTLQSISALSKDTYYFYSKKEMDITNIESVKEVFNSQDFDFCVNCAAYTNVEGAEVNVEQAFLVNATGVKNVAEVCQSKSVILIHISTDYVFNGLKKRPYKTDDSTNPINQYGRSKLQGELYIKEIMKAYYIIRTSWLYSAFGKNFVKTIMTKIDENARLNITTEENGTPTSCIDLSKFIIHLVENNSVEYGVYNFSAQGNTTWYGFAGEIAKLYYPKRVANISATDSFKTVAERPKNSVLDIEKTEKVYKNLKYWQQSLDEIVNELKKQ